MTLVGKVVDMLVVGEQIWVLFDGVGVGVK